MRTSLLSLVALVIWSVPCASQIRHLGPAPSLLFSAERDRPLRAAVVQQPLARLRNSIQPTHWKEGALIGATLGGVGGAFLGYGLYRNSDEPEKHCAVSTLLGGIVGAAVLMIPGALIGGQFPKRARSAEGEDVE